jgi:hypothetical protein
VSESEQVLVCVRGGSLLGENMGAASVVTSEKFGLKVNTEKKKEKKRGFIVISCEMNRGKVTALTWVVNALKLLHSSNTGKATYKSKLHWEEIKEQFTFRQFLLPLGPDLVLFLYITQ